jgi:hypothetical protein
MAGQDSVKELVKQLSKLGVLVAADVTPESLEGLDPDAIISRVIERRVSDSNFNIINNADVQNIIEEIKLDKAPKPIEVIQKSEYRALASEVDARYSITNKEIEFSNGTVDGFVSHFKSRLERLRAAQKCHKRNGLQS